MRELTIGNTKVRIIGTFCQDSEQVKRTLDRMARRIAPQLEERNEESSQGTAGRLGNSCGDFHEHCAARA